MKTTRHVGQVETVGVVCDDGLAIGNKIIRWTYPEARNKALADIPDGTWISETIKPVGKPMSLRQMGYYYAVILPTVHSQLVDEGHETMGIPISKDTADQVLKHYCSDGLLKRNMTVEDAKKFIDNCIRWASVNLGCSIPEPERI